MSVFDDLDQQLSDAIDAVVGESVVWHPMLRSGSGQYTVPTNNPDPDRPISEPFTAAVTWAPTTEAVGEKGEATVATFAVMVDIDRREFDGYPSIPVRYDRFEVEEEPRSSRWLEIQRVADDDSARLVFYCSVVKPQ